MKKWLLRSLPLIFLAAAHGASLDEELALPTSAFEENSVPREGFRDRYYVHQRQGVSFFGVFWRDARIPDYFFLAPAHFGGTLFTIVGNVVTWIPSIVIEVSEKGWALRNFLPPSGFVQYYIAPVGGYLLGTPFWLIKQGVYDFPVWLCTPSGAAKIPGAPHQTVREEQLLGAPENIPLDLIEKESALPPRAGAKNE